MKNVAKTTLIIAAALLFAAHTNAQTEKGSFLISGKSNLNFASLSVKSETGDYSRDDGKVTKFEVTPGLGYLIANNLAVGVQFSYESSAEKEGGSNYSESTTLLLPFARLYFGKGNVKPFIQAAYGPGWQKWGSANKQTENLTAFEADGGLAIFINRNIAINLAIGYGSAIAKYTTSNKTEWKTTASGIGGTVGFAICF